MKLHFYGCSFTAGDELIDDVYFPWKSECSTMTEYYAKRRDIFINTNKMREYERQNRMLAYPAHIEKLTGFSAFNHAVNGASLREMIYKIIHQVSTGDRPDYAFLQVTPTGREYMINNIVPMSIQVTSLDSLPHGSNMKKYVQEKIAVSTLYSWTVNDFMDLLMLDGFLAKRNIPYSLLDIGEIEIKQRDLINLSRYEFLNKEIDKLKPIYLREHCVCNLLTCGHFDADTHKRFAEYIVANIPILQ